MKLSTLLPQPFKELVTNYNLLKQELKTQQPTSKSVQVTATKVAICATHCLQATVLSCFLLGSAVVGAPLIFDAAVLLICSFVIPEATIAASSMTEGVVTLAILVIGVASNMFLTFLPCALIIGGMHFGLGYFYQSMMQCKWENFNVLVGTSTTSGLHLVDGWSDMGSKHKALKESIINYAQS